jgi:hypothetical protein
LSLMLRFFQTKSIPTIGWFPNMCYIVRLVELVFDEAADDRWLADALVANEDHSEFKHASLARCEAYFVLPFHFKFQNWLIEETIHDLANDNEEAYSKRREGIFQYQIIPNSSQKRLSHDTRSPEKAKREFFKCTLSVICDNNTIR